MQVYPPGHPVDPSFRDGLRGPEYAKPVTIGSDVWVGGGAIILGAKPVATHFLPMHGMTVVFCCTCTRAYTHTKLPCLESRVNNVVLCHVFTLSSRRDQGHRRQF